MSAPLVMPVSRNTSARSPTASTTAGSMCSGTGARSSCRPPWLDTTIASAPWSTTIRASSTVWIPLTTSLPLHDCRSQSRSSGPTVGSNMALTRSATVPCQDESDAKLSGSVVSMLTHPQWWVNMLTTEPLSFASLSSWHGTVADLVNAMFDPTVGPEDLDWLRQSWSGKLVVKGIQTVEDARMVVDHGADAIVVSNHGGRQLDRAPVPLHMLPAVVEAVGDRAEVFLDTGITSGADIVAALALGATACLVGRAYLYGLMAGGERGVERAVEILDGEIVRTLALLGVSRVADLNASHVVLHP